MFTIDDIIKCKDLEELFMRLTKRKCTEKVCNKEILRTIRNFCPILTNEIEPFKDDKTVLDELERCGRYSLINYIQAKHNLQ